MSTDNKTHYRKVFKSDHLGVAALGLFRGGQETFFYDKKC